MSTDVEIERALAAIRATLNDQKVEGFDTKRIQGIVDRSMGGERKLTVDDGGGLHDESGARTGATRRTDSGEWITERQNPPPSAPTPPFPPADQPVCGRRPSGLALDVFVHGLRPSG